MHAIREIDLKTDLPMLQSWWKGHGAIEVPEYLLPQGFLIAAGGVDIAAAFFYLDVSGKIASVEYLTTNPTVAFSRYLVEDVKNLIAHIEGLALAQAIANGRQSITMLSFVKPGTGEERLLSRLGYKTDDGPPHKIWAKGIVKEGV